MNRTNYQAARRLVVYAPPDGNRSLTLSDGRTWNSSEEGVVFFETGRYRDYTSGAWIKKLLNVLVRATSSRRIGLRIDAARIDKIPSWLSEKQNLNDILIGRFDTGHIDKFIEFFDATGSYGVWDCYGLSSEFEAKTDFEPLPEALEHCERYQFLVEIDLDAVLLGYVRPQKSAQELALALYDIGKG